MSLELVTPPASTVFTTAEAKTHLRVTQSAEDSYIDLLVKAATFAAETFLNRKLITQTWKLYLDEFPIGACGGNYNYETLQSFRLSPAAVIQVPYPKLQSVTHVKYYDSEGDLQTFAAENYQVDVKSTPGRIALGASTSVAWPNVEPNRFNAIEIQFVCGYGTASDIPDDIKQALRLMLTWMYEKRTDSAEIPVVAQKILWPYRMVEF